MKKCPTSCRVWLVSLLGLAAVLLLVGWKFWPYLERPLEPLDCAWYDLLLRQREDPARLPSDVVLVMIDEDSLQTVAKNDTHGRWPWPRSYFAELFAALKVDGAEQIVADLAFTEPTSAEEDDLLASYTAACGNVVVASLDGHPTVLLSSPVLGNHIQLKTGQVSYHPDPDGIIRGYRWEGSLAGVAAGEKKPDWLMGDEYALNWHASFEHLKKSRPELVLSAASFISQGRELRKKIAGQKVDEYDPAALRQALDKLREQTQDHSLTGKTVFIGANAAAAYDVKASPLDSLEPGVMAHYTAFLNMRAGNPILRHGANHFLLAFIFGWGFALFLLMKAYRRSGLWIVSAYGAAFFAIPFVAGWYLFQHDWFLFIWVSLVLTLIGFIIAAGARWWIEQREKNQIHGIFGNYVSDAVVQEFLKNPEMLNLGGEEKTLTIYFSDLAGFTTMSENMTPAELVRVLNLYLGDMSNFIIDEGGYLDKYIGDAIMGVFGSPLHLENPALSACRAALKSRDHLETLNQRFEKDYGVKLAARIGINTGPVIVGNLGAEKKRNYTVIGDAVNLASRLEGANKAFGTTILISETTHAALGGALITRPVDLVAVKGKKKPVQLYEVLAFEVKGNTPLADFLEKYTTAHGAYVRRDFSQALLNFEAALVLRPDDQLTKEYVERCRTFLVHPPGDDWDGVFVMKTK